MSSLWQIIHVVQVIDAVKRKPEEYKRQSFFGFYDLWHYIPVFDERLCHICEGYARRKVFRGTELRKSFAHLMIVDEDLIFASVHPNCRCYLFRIIGVREYLREWESLEKRELR